MVFEPRPSIRAAVGRPVHAGCTSSRGRERNEVRPGSAVDGSERDPMRKETTMQKISPHLWFDTQAREAGDFYASLFDDSRVKSVTTLDNTPSGSVDIVDVELCGQPFTFLAAGPLFKFNPSIS